MSANAFKFHPAEIDPNVAIVTRALTELPYGKRLAARLARVLLPELNARLDGLCGLKTSAAHLRAQDQARTGGGVL